MKHYNFVIEGEITVPDDSIDEESVSEDLEYSIAVPDCASHINITDVQLEED